MLTKDVHPTTILGIKRLATQIRKDQNLKHARALDLAAKAANFENYRHAQRALPVLPRQPKPYLLLTIYWLDKKLPYRRGRETLKIELSVPIFDICTKSDLKNVRGFGNLRMVTEDHFVCDSVADSQEYARQRLCTAERSRRFMEHTGLRPTYKHPKAYPNGLGGDKLPYIDHPTDWVDPIGGQYVLVDEPYGPAPSDAERADWAARTGWQIIKTSWPGMYNPYNCDLYIAFDGRSSYDIDALAARISGMPAPLIEANWSGDSTASWDTFVSPMGTSAQHKRRARCRGTIYPVASATSVPYSYNVGSSQRRPVGEMGIPGHIEAGKIIKAAMRSDSLPYGVYRRLNSLRSTLEDWLGLEIERGQLPGREFFDVYYGETANDELYRNFANSSTAIVQVLGELKGKLLNSYADCAALRRQLRRIEMSISMLRKVKAIDL